MLAQLMLSFLQVGAFSVGGGYAAIPLIRAQVVERYGWLSMEAFTNLVTIAEMTPGPIALNAATFVGDQVAGLPGAVLATLACILPSLVLVSLLSWLYGKYRSGRTMQTVLSLLRPAVVALIATAAVAMVQTALLPASGVDWLAAALFLGALALLRSRRASPILTMLGCGAVYTLAQALTGGVG